jgi:hypothetical protein
MISFVVPNLHALQLAVSAWQHSVDSPGESETEAKRDSALIVFTI